MIPKILLGIATVGSSGVAGTYAVEKFLLRVSQEKKSSKKVNGSSGSSSEGTSGQGAAAK